MAKSVPDLIKAAGGRHEIAARSRKTDKPVTFEAVAKWPRTGIPNAHWPLMIKLADATPQEIYAANLEAKAKAKASRARRSKKKKRVTVSVLRNDRNAKHSLSAAR